MKSKKALICAATGLGCLLGLVLLCVSLGRSFGGLSPLGDILAPSRGFWRHHPTDRADVSRRLAAALKDAGLSPVEIEIDQAEVPHLKATDDRALYFAQGFVTAYYRLWQMDFLSRITAGKVSEILGEKALPIDRFFRRMRLPSAAQASAELMMVDPVIKGPLAAYTQGVNARIGQIDISSLPIEYRLFGALPEVWTEERAAYLLKFMTWELTGFLYDFRMTTSKAKLSHALFENLFPLDAKVPGTILGDLPWKQTAVEGSNSNDNPRLLASNLWHDIPPEVMPEPANGSNNWAVPARLMANHRALLANDLHLGYTLPSLWFSIQLTSPTMNVYGASLPGAPGVIVGFTETMGWAVTNGTDDVVDWYSLRFRDERRQEYMFEDSWRPVVTRDEVIRIAGGRSEVVKTRETHVGPIVYDESDESGVIEIPSGLAVQWTGYTPSNELRSFLLLNRGENARDCLTALKGYIAPAQNFVCADARGKLVYQHAGLFPDRKGRDGRLVLDAAQDSDLWQGSLPIEENPSFETTSDLIVTANQPPFNGEGLHRYGWFFAAPYRALQIRARLDSKKSWQPEQMIELQADTTSWLAQNFKRLVLREAASAPLKDELDASACRASQSDENSTPCDRKLERKSRGGQHHRASYEQWFETLEEKMWTRVIGDRALTYWPSRWRFLEILDGESSSTIWDDPATPVFETLGFRLVESLRRACENLKENFGGVGRPTWASYQATVVPHAGRIPGLGRSILAGGEATAIFANKGRHGPTWKMIVTFEDHPRAWTMIPGGQSGDPSSPFYDDHLEAWSRGEMQPVTFNMRIRK